MHSFDSLWPRYLDFAKAAGFRNRPPNDFRLERSGLALVQKTKYTLLNHHTRGKIFVIARHDKENRSGGCAAADSRPVPICQLKPVLAEEPYPRP